MARVEVDGIDVSDEIVGSTTMNVPASAIQEFQLSQSSMDLSTELTKAKFEALRLATADARKRGETIAGGLGGSLGAVRSVQLGVFQITPRNSTEVSDYGINDTSTRDKDVTSVVTITFAVNR